MWRWKALYCFLLHYFYSVYMIFTSTTFWSFLNTPVFWSLPTPVHQLQGPFLHILFYHIKFDFTNPNFISNMWQHEAIAIAAANVKPLTSFQCKDVCPSRWDPQKGGGETETLTTPPSSRQCFGEKNPMRQVLYLWKNPAVWGVITTFPTFP